MQRLSALIILLFVNALFWACFEQAGNSLNFFAKDHVGQKGFFKFEWFQSVNPVYIILLAPVFAWLWVFLAKKNRNPSIPAKFGLGLIQKGCKLLAGDGDDLVIPKLLVDLVDLHVVKSLSARDCEPSRRQSRFRCWPP